MVNLLNDNTFRWGCVTVNVSFFRQKKQGKEILDNSTRKAFLEREEVELVYCI